MRRSKDNQEKEKSKTKKQKKISGEERRMEA
jgi:hypothetical protein